MMNPIIMLELAKARQSDLMKEAEHRRLISLLRAGQPSIIDRLLEKTGDLLTGAGERLQKRRALQGTGKLASAEK